MPDVPMVIYWQDRPITSLTREELIDALTEVGGDHLRLLKDYHALAGSIFRMSAIIS